MKRNIQVTRMQVSFHKRPKNNEFALGFQLTFSLVGKCIISTVDDNFNGAAASYYGEHKNRLEMNILIIMTTCTFVNLGHPNATSTTSRLSNTTHPTPRNKSVASFIIVVFFKNKNTIM